MKLGFEESQTLYESASQSARVWTERWVKDWVFCPNCGNPRITQYETNRPVADFFCADCSEEYELKSTKAKFGARVLDGAFRAMCARLVADNNPNLLLLNYDLKSFGVTNVFVVRDRQPQSKESVLAQWKRTLFLRDEGLEARGWLIEVMNCVDSIGKQEFQLDDVYAFESTLSQLYPNNRHVKQKIRQQLQVLRDRGYLDFVGRGYYRLRSQG